MVIVQYLMQLSGTPRNINNPKFSTALNRQMFFQLTQTTRIPGEG